MLAVAFKLKSLNPFELKVVHLGRSNFHAISGWGDQSTRIPDGLVKLPDHLPWSRRGHLLPASRGSGTHATKDPMWGYPVFVLGAIGSFLEPFCGYLSPKIDKVYEKMTLRYHAGPHEGPCVVPTLVGRATDRRQ